MQKRILSKVQFNEGFSYIEVLIVIAIMLILGGSIGFNALSIVDKARKISAENQIAVFKIALTNYYHDTGDYPAEHQGLEALWEKPIIEPSSDSWNGPYITAKLRRDPWNNAYVYSRQNSFGLPYTIVSYGADGEEGGEDNNADIVSWE